MKKIMFEICCCIDFKRLQDNATEFLIKPNETSNDAVRWIKYVYTRESLTFGDTAYDAEVAAAMPLNKIRCM
jgi:hypothetical protein